MRMGSWSLQDDEKEKIVTVFRDQFVPQVTQKRVYKGTQIDFSLVYSPLGKMLGYQLKYNYSKKYPKSVLFNCFSIFYNPRKEVNTKDLKLDVIYEDQVVRLLVYKHASGVNDYMLVGRWRIEAEGIGEGEPE